MKYELPELPYGFDALEPHIDARTMEIHFTKHHAGYVKKLNDLLIGQGILDSLSLEEILSDISVVPEDIRQGIRNNGGGHLNHTFFWKVMGPSGGGEPEGELLENIRSTFGGFDELRDRFTKAALDRFGSGWAWLCSDQAGALSVISTPNQDSPLMQGLRPILGVDVWEHAYYLKYQNRRPEYVEAWWNVVNWEAVAEFYARRKEKLYRLVTT